MSRSLMSCRHAKRHDVIVVLVLSSLTLATLFWGGLLPMARAATTFVVTNTNDTGTGSLRQAILDANANPGADLITFNIGSGLQTIRPLSLLPDITDPVVIDATTQPGFEGSPLIELNATSIPFPSQPRWVLRITAGNTTVRGLIIRHFRDGISIVNVGGNHIEGCYIGIDATGNVATNSSGIGITIDNSPNNTIGGTTADKRNVISGFLNGGISIFGINGTGNQIQGNYIGTNAAGTAGLGNFVAGILLGTSNNTVGGTVPGARNVISANGDGILMRTSGTSGNLIQGNYIGTDASGQVSIGNRNSGIAILNSSNNNLIGGTIAGAGNVISGNTAGITVGISADAPSGNMIQGNYIGVAADGSSPLDNGVVGIHLTGAINTVVGGTVAGAGNTIAFNGPIAVLGGTGVVVFAGTGNSIQGNSIFSNGLLGIDLGRDGVTPNDTGDGDSGGNLRQNFPLITSVVSEPPQTTISGTLNSTANTTFFVDFYSNAACDPSGNGEGARPFGLSSTSVTTDVNGNATFGVALSIPLPTGRVITATATDPLGNTSEFSPCNSSAAMGSVKFGSDSLIVNEDVEFATFTVNRVGGSFGTLAVEYSTVDNTATAGQDYTATSGTLTFANGETTMTLQVPILDDSVTEPTESLLVLLRNPNVPDSIGNPNTSVLTLQDHSTLPGLSVNDVQIIEGDTGTTNAVFTVSLIATGRTVTVNYATSGGDATSGVDFQPVAGSLTFDPRVTTQTISVPVIGDTTFEFSERFTVALNNPSNAVILHNGTGTIVDEDPPPSASISDVTVNEGNSGTTTAVFTVSLSAPSGRFASVRYRTADGSASSPSDYVAQFDDLTFEAGETNKSVAITIRGDILGEPDETFFVNITLAGNATVLDGQGLGTILNDDGPAPPGVQFSATTATATETFQATTMVELTVIRGGDTSGAASVGYASSDGTANDRSDYLAALGTLRFQAGETLKTITVFIVDDAYGETAENFTVTLSNAVGSSLGSHTTVTVTINSNEFTNGPNPVRDIGFRSDFFVRQHYVDFLNREADAAGLAFWKNQIDECTTQACREIRRINVSAAFFLAIEFQQTGYLVYKAYQAAFNSGEQLRLQSFLPDTHEIGRGFIFGQPGADDRLETNKRNFFLDFVQRPGFLAPAAYPTTLTAAQFVDKLNGNTFDPLNPGAGALTLDERNALVALLSPDPTSTTLRAQVLRSVSENELFTQRQFNKAFVLMQYFGYLRRNPDATPDLNFNGYNFWLAKLNQFGNFVDAEMVKAFITSGEYIHRFGP